MKRTYAMIVILILGITVALAAGGRSTSSGSGFTELYRGAVAGTDDIEVVMGLVERSGESMSGKHYHPGGEFGYVIEGSVTVVSEGEPEATHKAGDSFYQRPGKWHVISTTAQGAKAVVFRVLKKGQPAVVAVE